LTLKLDYEIILLMKFISFAERILAPKKLIVLLIAIPAILALFSVVVLPASRKQTQHAILAQKTTTPTPTTKVTPTTKPTEAEPTQALSYATSSGKVEAVVATATPTVTPTPTPAPYSSGELVMNGAKISSMFPEVTVRPGEQTTAFTITSTGTKGFKLTETRIVGVTGLSFSPMDDVIDNGQTKNILLTAATIVPPGDYSGYVSVKVDSGDEKQLRITIHVQGNQTGNTPSLKITGPSAGSVFKEGDMITITWDAQNVSGNFELSVVSENGQELSFANPDNGARSYTWKSERFFDPNATHFKFSIAGGGIRLYSPDFITINP
jgi:hypothetical protein